MNDPKIDQIYGRNPVLEVMRAGRRPVQRLLVAEGAQERETLAGILELAAYQGVNVERVPRADLERVSVNHQGVVAEASLFPYSELQDILDFARNQSEPLFVLLLDVLQDPQNVAVLLRTAEAVGVHGVILPQRRSAGVTPAVVSASAGACEYLLVAQHNIALAMKALQEAGAWVVGLEGAPKAQSMEEIDLSGPLAVVVGGEGSGMRRLVRDTCDFLMRIPMRGRVESLNAAVAGSIALYKAWGARGYRGRIAS